MSKKYQKVALGGTFDHFHIGHQALITYAATVADHLIIGITSPLLTQHKILSHCIESYKHRHKSVHLWCQSQGISHEIIELQDAAGTTVSDTSIQALVLTDATLPGGHMINQLRVKKGKKELPLLVAPLISDQQGNIISSTRIRLGEINRNGYSYVNLMQKLAGSSISDAQRVFFGKLQGKLISKPRSNSPKKWLVGDMTTDTFLAQQWEYAAAFFDRKTRRKPSTSQQLESLELSAEIDNPASTFSQQLVDCCLAINQASDTDLLHILVNGEEDLATIVLVLIGSLDAVIYYGQPNQGIVELEITEKKKQEFAAQFAELNP